MADLHKNFAYSTVATAPSPAASGTSLVVASGEGARFPSVPFNLVIWPTGTQPTSANAEIVTVTAISTDTLTIVRSQEGSVARTVVAGDQVAAAITLRTLNDVEGELAPNRNMTIQAGFSAYYPQMYETVNGYTTEIGSGAILEIG